MQQILQMHWQTHKQIINIHSIINKGSSTDKRIKPIFVKSHKEAIFNMTFCNARSSIIFTEAS